MVSILIVPRSCFSWSRRLLTLLFLVTMAGAAGPWRFLAAAAFSSRQSALLARSYRHRHASSFPPSASFAALNVLAHVGGSSVSSVFRGRGGGCSDRSSPSLLRDSYSSSSSSSEDTTTTTISAKEGTTDDENNAALGPLQKEQSAADDLFTSTAATPELTATSSSSSLISWRKRWRRRTGGVFSAVGFVTSSTRALLTDRSQFQRQWRPTVDALRQFLERSGIDLEIASLLNVRLLDNIIILSRVEKAALNGRDRRDLALSSSISPSMIPSNEKALRYMRFATAAYGDAMIRAAEMDVLGKFDNRISSFDKISEHTSVPDEDIVSMDIDYAGDANHLRHFVAVDHAHKNVVLSIRGTFALSEVVVDAAGFSRPFCGGEAHSEMATMAERLWEVTGPTVLHMLDDNPTYTLILTGHSLGAGVATLLNILLHQDDGARILGRTVECFALAAPPTFSPLESVPSRALASCTNYIHERDVVPFLSVDSVRHLFNCVKSIEEQAFSWTARLKFMTGYSDPDSDLIEAVRRANENRLITKPGAPVLAVPAKANVWIKEDVATGTYDAKICDSATLALLGIHIDAKMLEDHFPSRYEHGLHNMKY